jgi:GrpB-like predicted nucleotidyltransferase (UPF0157 family)
MRSNFIHWRASAALCLLSRIEHTGSTALPGMLAKPIIAIMIGIRGASGSEINLEQLDHEDIGEAGGSSV